MGTGSRRLNPAPHLLIFTWDIMSQMLRTAQDNSSQEKQDTRPITMASTTGMLLTEKDSGHLSAHFDVFLSRKGEEYVFYTTVSRERH